MAKAITDIFGLSERLKDLMAFDGDDRVLIDNLLEEFSENIVVAADSHAIATQIVEIARKYTEEGGWGCPDLLEESPDIDFNRILDLYRDTDQDEVGYTYEAMKDAIFQVYTDSECVHFVQKSLEGNFGK